jgi:fatty acid kinase fatty acid binding subunit
LVPGTGEGARVADVAIVTDSTAYLPQALTERLGIEVVSLYYDLAGRGATRESDLNGEYNSFYADLAASGTVAVTSPPTSEDFSAAYERLLESHRSVVAVCIASAMSETCTTARKVAQEFGGERVVVIDSAGVGGHLGLQVLAAARAASGGASLEGVIERVHQARKEIKAWCLVGTLEYFRRSDRVGNAAAWIGAALDIKPILTIESELKAVERVRTRKRGMERLIELMRQRRSLGADRWMVQHAHAPEDALRLVDRLGGAFDAAPEFIAEIGPVTGTHVGPGALIVGALPAAVLR